MLEGRDGMARDADGGVVVLQQQVDEHHDAQAVWLLGLCCEYGMGTQQDTQRAQHLLTHVPFVVLFWFQRAHAGRVQRPNG